MTWTPDLFCINCQLYLEIADTTTCPHCGGKMTTLNELLASGSLILINMSELELPPLSDDTDDATGELELPPLSDDATTTKRWIAGAHGDPDKPGDEYDHGRWIERPDHWGDEP